MTYFEKVKLARQVSLSEKSELNQLVARIIGVGK